MISKSSSRSTTKKSFAKREERSAYERSSTPAIAFSLNRGRTGLNVTAHGATALILAVAPGAGAVGIVVLIALRVIH